MGEAQRVRRKMARQRAVLRRASMREIVQALLNPPPELGIYKLGTLLAPKHHGGDGLIRGFGPVALARAFRRIERSHPLGRHWHRELKLGELTDGERKRLVRAVARSAPASWRGTTA